MRCRNTRTARYRGFLFYCEERHLNLIGCAVWKFWSNFLGSLSWAADETAVARRNERNSPLGVFFLIFTSARPVDEEADAKIGKNKEYWARAMRSCSRRLCFWPLAFSFAPFESKEKADKKHICFYGERCFYNIYTYWPLFSLSRKAQREKLSVKNIVVLSTNAWRVLNTPCFFLFSRRLNRPQDAPTWKSKEKRRFRSFARCDERPPFRRRLATNFWKSLIKTFL